MKFDQGQQLSVREEWVGSSALTLRLSGEFDLASRERFEARLELLERDHVRELVIDLTGLTFLDSSGIRTLLGAKRWAKQDGCDLFFALPENGQVRKVLDVTGVVDALRPENDS